jgi:hypothetical protein
MYLPESQIQTSFFIIFTYPNPVLLVPGFWQVGKGEDCKFTYYTGHSTHFPVGGDNSKVNRAFNSSQAQAKLPD